MPNYKIDNFTYRLKEKADLHFLSNYGEVFCAFDENDSGNISFGTNNGKDKYFIKVAGAKTLNACVSPETAIKNLKNALPIYTDLKHLHLISLIEHFSYHDLYIAVFRWVDGECLFDHWNFEKYRENPTVISPANRFINLPLDKKLAAFSIVCSFFAHTAKQGYVAIDFYDGSIMYDFDSDKITICDIDLYRKSPAINDMGKMWGSSRFMSPEEYELGATLDEVTNVFTLGAIAFMMFGSDTDHSFEKWTANKDLYYVAAKATNADREKRYQSINAFITDWDNSI